MNDVAVAAAVDWRKRRRVGFMCEVLSLLPFKMGFFSLLDSPKRQAARSSLDDTTHSLCFGVQLGVSQDTANIFSHQVWINIQPYETIRPMAQTAFAEILIVREECWPVQLMQHGN